ncbi:MAG TPA: sigma factor, partial [Salinarimonas sp.]|nr:sigma factor [Salinarimonas sp.]
MRAARRGDAAAYERLLAVLAAAIRPTVRRRLARMGLGTSETEDVVQEVLLAIHAKRHTWDEARPILPWVGAVARYKVVDAVRRL